MTIEFETLAGTTVTAPLSSVRYIHSDKKSHFVTMEGSDVGKPIDQANYNKIREALRGFDEVETEEKP